MTREQLEHVIRAAAMIADDDEIMIIGSQSILGQFPHAPEELCVSNEVDLWPRNHPQRSDLVDGSIGELSLFHETFGYYGQGVGPTTAVLPHNWESRLIPVRTPATRGATGLCLEVHDLLISKYVASRPKDGCFVSAAIRHGLAKQRVLLERVKQTPIDTSRQKTISDLIGRDFSNIRSGRVHDG